MEDQPHSGDEEQSRDEGRSDPEVPARGASTDPKPKEPEGRRYDARRAVASTREWFCNWLRPRINATALSPSFWTALATVVIAAATIVYTYFAHQQWDVMSKTLFEIAKQTPEIQKQAKAAQDQLAQAKVDSAASTTSTAQQLIILQKQLIQQEKAMETDERAWVSIRGTALSEEPQADRPVIIALGVFNSGRTPALDVHSVMSAYSGSHQPPDVDWPKYLKGSPHWVLWPQQDAHTIHTDPLSLANSLGDYNAGINSVYIQVKITYKDVFGVEHWTTVCKLHHHGRPLNEWDSCRSGNNADQPEQRSG